MLTPSNIENALHTKTYIKKQPGLLPRVLEIFRCSQVKKLLNADVYPELEKVIVYLSDGYTRANRKYNARKNFKGAKQFCISELILYLESKVLVKMVYHIRFMEHISLFSRKVYS